MTGLRFHCKVGHQSAYLEPPLIWLRVAERRFKVDQGADMADACAPPYIGLS